MIWRVPTAGDAERADKVLANVSGCSRSAARRALENGDVTFDGAVVTARFKVVAGGSFAGEIVDDHEPLEPEFVEFGVVYEDDHLAVIDKPAGLVTHPGAGRRTGTLAGGILHRWPQVRGVGTEDRWGIVHRLDRETSGLLAVALDADAFTGLSTAIRHHDVVRQYLALVNAQPAAPTGTIDAPVSRDPKRPTRMRVDSDGRRAVTHYRLDRAWKDQSLLSVTLETGRTHQIRVHLASIGLPVAGDRTYGTGGGSPRMFLHAIRLAFEHPVTGAAMEFEAPLPSELLAVLGGLDSATQV